MAPPADKLPGNCCIQCDYCDFTSNKYAEVQQHESQQHAAGHFRCNICQLSFRHRQNLSEHMQTKKHLKKSQSLPTEARGVTLEEGFALMPINVDDIEDRLERRALETNDTEEPIQKPVKPKKTKAAPAATAGGVDDADALDGQGPSRGVKRPAAAIGGGAKATSVFGGPPSVLDDLDRTEATPLVAKKPRRKLVKPAAAVAEATPADKGETLAEMEELDALRTEIEYFEALNKIDPNPHLEVMSRMELKKYFNKLQLREQVQDDVDMMRDLVITTAWGMETFSYVVPGAKLQGYQEHVTTNIERFDRLITKLLAKYGGSNMPVEAALMLLMTRMAMKVQSQNVLKEQTANFWNDAPPEVRAREEARLREEQEAHQRQQDVERATLVS